MTRTVLLVALLGVAACESKDGQPVDTDTGFPRNETEDTYESGLWAETDTDPWLETGLDTDVDDTDLIDTDAGCTQPGWTIDCSGLCSSESLIGDGFCDEGGGTKPDFFCEDFEFDGGDCFEDTAVDTDLCPFPGEVPDCNGNCFASFLVGDGTCHDDPAPGVDFACDAFGDDGGDCVPDSDTQVVDTDTAVDTDAIALPCDEPLQIRDCNAICWPEAWLGDDRCDDGTERVWGDPDFDCAYYQRDQGDCPDTDAPVDTSLPIDTDTDLPLDTDTDLPVDTDTDLPVDTDTDLPVDTLVPDTDLPLDTLVPDTLPLP